MACFLPIFSSTPSLRVNGDSWWYLAVFLMFLSWLDLFSILNSLPGISLAITNLNKLIQSLKVWLSWIILIISWKTIWSHHRRRLKYKSIMNQTFMERREPKSNLCLTNTTSKQLYVYLLHGSPSISFTSVSWSFYHLSLAKLRNLFLPMLGL